MVDLRLHTKSGNDYYVDISEYDTDNILETITDSVDRGDILTLHNKGNIFVLKCKEVEFFEIIFQNELMEEMSENYNIGFYIEKKPDEQE